MASVVLHIKDSYYFDVPKSFWESTYASKAQFPDVWVQLDPDYQLWEAERLHAAYLELRPDLPAFEQLKSEYVAWTRDHKHAGKPFDRFLEESADREWLSDP